MDAKKREYNFRFSFAFIRFPKSAYRNQPMILLLGLAVEFNLFGSFEGFVHVPFDCIGDMLWAIGRDFEGPSNRAGA